MKKPIHTRLHGLLDYISAFILILPWIVGFFAESKDTWILSSIGTCTILISLCTDYEYGLIKGIPMTAHLVLDILTALTLIVLPFVFPVYHYAFYWPVIVGFTELIIIALSSSKPYVITRQDLNITQP